MGNRLKVDDEIRAEYVKAVTGLIQPFRGGGYVLPENLKVELLKELEGDFIPAEAKEGETADVIIKEFAEKLGLDPDNAPESLTEHLDEDIRDYGFEYARHKFEAAAEELMEDPLMKALMSLGAVLKTK